VSGLLLISLVIGCRTSSPSADDEYERIVRDLTHGDLLAAESKADQAVRRYAGRDDEVSWRFRTLAAKVDIQQGKSLDALHELAREMPPSLANGDLEVQREMFLAVAYARLGQLEQAVQCLSKAERLSELTHSALQAELLSIRGVVDLEEDNPADAEKAFAEGLELARHQNDKYLQARISLNLGVVELNKEHFDKARDWFDTASEIARSVGAQLVLEKALANAGWAYYKLGDFEKALINFQRAEEQSEKLGGKYDQVAWLANTGLAQYQLNDLRAAEGSYRKSLVLAETIHNQVEILAAEQNLGFLLLQRGEIQPARENCDDALKIAVSIGNKSSRLEPTFLHALLVERSGDRKKTEDILETLEGESAGIASLRWKVEDELAKIHADAGEFGQADLWFRKAIDTFETQRRQIQNEDSKLPFFTNASQVYGDYAEYLVNHGRSDEALKLIDLGRARTLLEGLGIAKKEARSLLSENLDAKGVARRLHGTILSYWLGPTESYLWAITSSQVKLFKLPKESEISELVRSYQKSIQASNDVLAANNDAGQSLYQNLIAPAQAMIPKDSKVFIIPDGSLNQLNFETLLVPKPAPHYWIEDAVVVSANSVRMLAAFATHPRTQAPANLLLIGDPLPPGGPYEELPNAAREAAAIERYFSPERRMVLTRERALPSAYGNSHPEQYSYIHFVAHGTASRLTPLESAVILSPAPGDPDTFKLYARDIKRYPLRAELVTVSACYGSGARAYAGEGLVGLSWAFLRAGSHYVAAALWEVSDSATPQLMDHMYSAVKQGGTPDVAMREAKLSLVHSQGTYRKPLYWGSFQMYAGS
jgi:CHAT domain-containing protein/Tfp pilus assembly protein PilF